MRISDWSSDVCSSDLDQPTSRGVAVVGFLHIDQQARPLNQRQRAISPDGGVVADDSDGLECLERRKSDFRPGDDADENLVSVVPVSFRRHARTGNRSEEHTSELQSLMRISYAVFC